ncbi:hypothetical protein M011DRAFT_475040 [Sporormia fimetaria CBS 119925]|uniref:Uncharacterized protein n=1 Tax=Sporormia fimetaria CBS 119925 TaxID=1340428 RepID=A0A6A6VKG5_9PLEO|nr:hypothetical protein M011DRAFT_475040 [Sporormia fimetaria CBS 119925]
MPPQKCTDPSLHPRLHDSLTNVLTSLSLPDIPSLTALLTSPIFLPPFLHYRDIYLLHPDYNDEGLLASTEASIAALLPDILSELQNGENGELDTSAEGRQHTVRLYARLLRGLNAVAEAWSEEAVEKMCKELYVLIRHIRRDYVHGHGVCVDVIEAVKECEWLREDEAGEEHGKQTGDVEVSADFRVGIEVSEVLDEHLPDLTNVDDWITPTSLINDKTQSSRQPSSINALDREIPRRLSPVPHTAVSSSPRRQRTPLPGSSSSSPSPSQSGHRSKRRRLSRKNNQANTILDVPTPITWQIPTIRPAGVSFDNAFEAVMRRSGRSVGSLNDRKDTSPLTRQKPIAAGRRGEKQAEVFAGLMASVPDRGVRGSYVLEERGDEVGNGESRHGEMFLI